MSKAIIKNMKDMWWEKKPFPTKEYILLCILEELRELNETLKTIHK